jgi:hypothetical protein
MKITSKLLRSKGACEEQVLRFIELGGDELELTEELCVRHANKFAWHWAGRRLLKKGFKYYILAEEDAWGQYLSTYNNEGSHHSAVIRARKIFDQTRAAAFWSALQMEESNE